LALEEIYFFDNHLLSPDQWHLDLTVYPPLKCTNITM
jgi:hypothetical protein